MNCFMSYNPNVAHEVKVTTWIKEFDGAPPVYPSFPNEGDVFIVFDNDEATEPSVNKTFSSGDWADTSSGDAPTGTITITENGEGIDVSSYATADVNVSGGDSDYTTAQVSIVSDAPGGYAPVYFSYILEGYDGMWCDGGADDGATYTVPMYKGKACLSHGDSTDYYSLSGDAEFDDEEGTIIVTGDCTITYTYG